jgi:hypothetical protein
LLPKPQPTSQDDLFWANEAFNDSLHNRRFFTTPDEDFGLCPEETKPGDIIVILYGGPTSYVFRKTPYPADMSLADQLQQGPTYTFIGECFFEKYMYGSAMGQAGPTEQTLQRFKYQNKVFTLD